MTSCILACTFSLYRIKAQATIQACPGLLNLGTTVRTKYVECFLCYEVECQPKKLRFSITTYGGGYLYLQCNAWLLFERSKSDTYKLYS
jgi:hypothetical protein